MNLRRVATLVLGMLVLAGLSAFAEPPVNFTGTWQLDKTRSVLPASVPSRGDMTMVIDLTVKRPGKEAEKAHSVYVKK